MGRNPLFGSGRRRRSKRLGYRYGYQLEDQDGQGVLREMSYLRKGGQWAYGEEGRGTYGSTQALSPRDQSSRDQSITPFPLGSDPDTVTVTLNSRLPAFLF